MEKIKAFFKEVDKLYHIIAGLIVGAIFITVLPMAVPIVPVIFAVFIKEFIDQWRGSKFDWLDVVATLIGGAIIQCLILILMSFKSTLTEKRED